MTKIKIFMLSAAFVAVLSGTANAAPVNNRMVHHHSNVVTVVPTHHHSHHHVPPAPHSHHHHHHHHHDVGNFVLATAILISAFM